VQSSWQGYCDSSLSLFHECRPINATLRPSQTDLRCEYTNTPTIAIYDCYSAQRLIFILSSHKVQKLSRSRYYIPTGLPARRRTVTHPSTNRARRRVKYVNCDQRVTDKLRHHPLCLIFSHCLHLCP